MRRLLLATTVPILALLLLPPAAHADTASRTAQTSYTCQIRQNGGSKPIDTEPMTLGIQLDVPTSVTPGQSVALRGTLSLAFPETLAKDAKGFVSTADGYSDTMSIELGVNGAVTSLRADRWQTPQIPVGDPLVVHAPITFPAFTVPADAAGSVTLGMARNGVLANPWFASPSPIAFTATASASGGLGTFKFDLACYLTGGQPAAIAQIPVTAAGQAALPALGGGAATQHKNRHGTAAAPTASTASTAPAATATPTGSASAPAATAPAAPGGAVPPAAQSAAAAAGSPGTFGDPTTTATTQLAARSGSGVYVSSTLLLTLGALVCLAALGYAGWAHYRLRVLQARLDD